MKNNRPNMKINRALALYVLTAIGVLGVTAVQAADTAGPAIQLRVVDNELQVGTAATAPYYVQWRTPDGSWQTWSDDSALPEDVRCVWVRGVFEPDVPFSWEIPEDVNQVLSPAWAVTDTSDGTHWSTFAGTDADGVIRASTQTFVQDTVSFSMPPVDADTPRNNQAKATPDPGRVKVYWHNSSTRYVAAWMMSDTGLLKSYGLSNEGGMSAGWILSGVGDINRDGVDDLLWYNSSSRLVAYWMMEPDGYIASSGLCQTGGMASGWTLRAFGDINRDGTADVAWHNTSTRRVAYWMLNQDGTLDEAGFCNDGGMADGWVLSGQGDVNGDGTMDFLWHNSSTRRVAYWFLNQDGTLDEAGFCNDGGMAAGWEFRGTGDIKGDGTVAIFWHNSSTARVAYWILGTDGVLGDFGFCNDGVMASGWVLSATGDLNNDGTSDLLWHNAVTRKVAYWLLTTNGTLNTSGFSTDLTMSTGWEIKGAGL
ncbi:MAG: VCBS repeat-containing protein [Kiritimatiellae bacterium]|nr:VCBS repeat-containing protein [Kiritimatiellia bacterium]MDD4737479.1 VCBS repeat-containing protein [Kiritimatiellia bacterium]